MPHTSSLKKIVLTTFIVLISLPILASAQTNPDQATGFTNASNRLQDVGQSAGFNNALSLPVVIGLVIESAISIMGIFFISYIVYAGWNWLTARGDEDKIKKSKTVIRGSIIGLMVVLGAYAITEFVLSRFVGEGGVYNDQSQTITDTN